MSAPAPEQPERPALPKRALALLAACVFVQASDFLVIGPLVPTLAAETGEPVARVMLLIAVQAAVGVLADLVSGAISDRVGRKPLIGLGLGALALSGALASASESFSSLMLYRGLAGAGGGLVIANAFASAADRVPYADRGLAMGLVAGAQGLAASLGILLNTSIATWLGWRWAFRALGLQALLAGILLFALLDEPARQRRPPLDLRGWAASYRRLLSRPAVPAMLGCTVLWYGAFQGLFQLAGSFYEHHYALTPQQIGLALLPGAAGYIAGNVLGGRGADRWGKRAVLTGACLIAALSMPALTSVTGALWGVLAISVVWIAAVGAGEASLLALVSELDSDARGALMALNTACTSVGVALFTALGAWSLGWGSFVVPALICSAGALGCGALLRRAR